MTNADKFKNIFGLYATELWSMPEKDFLKWLNSEAMNCSEFPNNSDTISRKWLMECVDEGWIKFDTEKDKNIYVHLVRDIAPSAQPEIVRCKDCIYYDPPHVENNGVRYEYDEMPADAFDALGTGLVNAEYGINIGGRCCVDYYCKNYSDDKRVFVREDNYCGRAERRTDE